MEKVLLVIIFVGAFALLMNIWVMINYAYDITKVSPFKFLLYFLSCLIWMGCIMLTIIAYGMAVNQSQP